MIMRQKKAREVCRDLYIQWNWHKNHIYHCEISWFTWSIMQVIVGTADDDDDNNDYNNGNNDENNKQTNEEFQMRYFGLSWFV